MVLRRTVRSRAGWGFRPTAVLVAMTALFVAQPALAGELVAIEVTSRHVDMQEEPGRNEPGRPPTLHANVLLPDGYDRRSRRGYPVLYLLHGAAGYYRTWEEVHDVVEVASGFPGIIVMPDGGAFGMYTDWYNGGEFGRPRWMTYHLTDLRRAIHRRFPVRPGRRWHAIAGQSMGGMGAIRYAAAAPGYFGSAASFSGAALDTQAPYIVALFTPIGLGVAQGSTYDDVWGPPGGYYATATNPLKLIPNLQHTRLFVTAGDGAPCPGDPVPPPQGSVVELGVRHGADVFVDSARARGVDVSYRRTCGAHHFPTTKRSLMGGLAWGFFGPVSQHPRSWGYITAAQRSQVYGLRFRFAAQPTTVVRFEREHQILRGDGTGTVSIRRGRQCVIEQTLPFEITMPRNCRALR